MRFEFDESKSRAVERKHGEFRAIGWCRGRLCSVVFEIRHDADGEYYHLVTA